MKYSSVMYLGLDCPPWFYSSKSSTWTLVKVFSLGNAKALYVYDATSWDDYKILFHHPQ